MICLVLSGSTLEENLSTITQYRDHIDLVELRADFLSAPDLGRIAAFPSLCGLPAVLTMRRERDGGRFGGGEAERLAVLARGQSGEKPFAYLDLEEDLPRLADLEEAAAVRGTRIIRSFHDFSGMPADLLRRVDALARTPTEVPKAAVMLTSARDLVELYNVSRSVKNPGRPRLLVGMGPFGVPTRLLASRFGSLFTFASPAGKETAPGHLDPATLDTVYRCRKTGSGTQIFGIIGNPVMHTRSPWIHNPAYTALGLDAVYIPFQLDDLSVFPRLTSAFGISGLSVTVPFKEAVLPYLESAEEAVRRTGACNTVVRSPSGWKGYNTDVEGFLAPLSALNVRWNTLGATVLGAGGAARSVVYGLVREGARVRILNRTADRARALAEEFGCSWGQLDETALRNSEGYTDLIVQTTTSGMSPRDDEDPSAGYAFRGTEIAYDIVYHPRMTRFLERASRAGCRIIGGEEMLLSQARRQFLLFTGKPFPAT